MARERSLLGVLVRIANIRWSRYKAPTRVTILGSKHFLFFSGYNFGLNCDTFGLPEKRSNSSEVYICKSIVNDLKHGNFTCKSEENFHLCLPEKRSVHPGG